MWATDRPGLTSPHGFIRDLFWRDGQMRPAVGVWILPVIAVVMIAFDMPFLLRLVFERIPSVLFLLRSKAS
jgi:hypothetical protein